jgi:putative hemolysin
MLAVVVFLGGCVQPATEPQPSGLANPASVYCEELGYTNEARQDDSGAMYGVCIFPDGSECEEWDFMAGRCGQERSFCVQQGYEPREESGNMASCVFPDGSSCPEYEFLLGDCGPGDAPPESQGEPEAEAEVEVDPYPGWNAYSNPEYGFSMRYPVEWSLEDVPDEDTTAQGGPHYGRSLQLTREGVLLYIGYRRADEQVVLGGSGMPAGDFEPRGKVLFLDQMMDKQALVFEGKVKALVYSQAQVDDLVFVIRADDMRPLDYGELEISAEIQEQVDQILGSFELAN